MVSPSPHSVRIVAYDSAWPERAAAESTRLTSALGALLVRVEHIGSTSVPGLAAKPIVDLIPVVTDLAALDGEQQTVEALGYDWFGEFGIAGRRYCSLTIGGERQVHLHFYTDDSPEIQRHLVFRDYLRTHPERAQAYAQEKRRAAALHPNDSWAYNEEKQAWVKAEEMRALAWLEREDH